MKKTGKIILKTVGGLVGVILLYLLCVLLLPYIPIAKKPTTAPESYDIYILSNGVHTDLVLPLHTPVFQWERFVPTKNTIAGAQNYKYVGIGWGDKGFYLDTPTWSQLKVSTALKAAFWLSESAMHCTYYQTVKEDDQCKKITLTEEQYRRLCSFVQHQFDTTPQGKPILIPTDAVYGKNDAFYDAKGSYSFLETCNTWTNRGLKIAGQKAALWTATDTGIFLHYR